MARRGKLVESRTYGWADEKERRPVTTASLFRIASVSKPITAVGVLKLVEKKKLALDDLVFGKRGLLNRVIRNPKGREGEISVEHLLRHSAGEPWGNAGADPMFRWDLSGRELIRRVHCGGADSNPATAKTRIASRLSGRRGNRINLDSPRLAQRLSSTVFPTPWSNTAALPLAEGVRRRLSVTVLSLVAGPRSTAGKPDAMTTFL